MNEVLMLHFFTGKAEMKTSGKGLWGWAVLVCFHGAISGNRDSRPEKFRLQPLYTLLLACLSLPYMCYVLSMFSHWSCEWCLTSSKNLESWSRRIAQGQARLIVCFRSVWVTEWHSNPPLRMSLCVQSGVVNLHSSHWVEEKKGNFVPDWASVVVAAATAWEKLQKNTSPVSHRDLPHIELEVFLWQAFNKPQRSWEFIDGNFEDQETSSLSCLPSLSPHRKTEASLQILQLG